MIEVEFRLGIKHILGKDGEHVEINGEIHLAKLVEMLGLPEDSVGMLFINGVWAPLDSVIKDGDHVRLFPDVEGG